jgi:hypothetical protein
MQQALGLERSSRGDPQTPLPWICFRAHRALEYRVLEYSALEYCSSNCGAVRCDRSVSDHKSWLRERVRRWNHGVDDEQIPRTGV